MLLRSNFLKKPSVFLLNTYAKKSDRSLKSQGRVSEEYCVWEMKSLALSGSMLAQSGASEGSGESPRRPSRPSPHMPSPPSQLSAVPHQAHVAVNHSPCGMASLENSRQQGVCLRGTRSCMLMLLTVQLLHMGHASQQRPCRSSTRTRSFPAALGS